MLHALLLVAAMATGPATTPALAPAPAPRTPLPAVAARPATTTFPAAARPLAPAARAARRLPLELVAPAERADSVVVEKGVRRLTLYRRGTAIRSYLVALGRNPVGAKQVQGDGRTPEGLYRISVRNARSRYHLGLRISYPSDADRARAAAIGATAGGDVMLHGLPPAYAAVGAAHRAADWTEGCVALTDAEIEEIWRLVPVGTPIEIRR